MGGFQRRQRSRSYHLAGGKNGTASAAGVLMNVEEYLK
jgi:hypothetical protein